MTDPDTLAQEIISRHFEGNHPEGDIAQALAADIADTFRTYADEKVAEETEACAKVIDEYRKGQPETVGSAGLRFHLAIAIRSRTTGARAEPHPWADRLDSRPWFNDLRKANVHRQQLLDTGNQITLVFRGNELAGEVGEACNVIKKIERERLGIRGSRATKEQLAEELADVVICADLIAMHEGIDLDQAVADKFNATSEKVGLPTRLRSWATITRSASPPPAAVPPRRTGK